MTPNQLQALACEDCVAGIGAGQATGLRGPVTVVVIDHEPTCPWLARVAPDNVTTVAEGGIVRHQTRPANPQQADH